MNRETKGFMILILIILITNLVIIVLLGILVMKLTEIKTYVDELNLNSIDNSFKNISLIMNSGIKDVKSALNILLHRNCCSLSS